MGWFPFEFRKEIGSVSITPHDGLKKKLALPFHPIRRETKTSCDLSFDWVSGLYMRFVTGQSD